MRSVSATPADRPATPFAAPRFHVVAHHAPAPPSRMFMAMFALLLLTADADAMAAALMDEVGADDDFERAAFVVRGKDGRLSMVAWPTEHLFRRARWNGSIPENVVAVVHTHPVRMPLPSAHDVAEARRTGIPFYVVTRLSLCVVEPNGRFTFTSTKPRPKLRRVSPAADDRRAAALEVNPE